MERCGSNYADIQQQLAQLSTNRKALTAVSFEDYDLGYNGELIYNGFTSVNDVKLFSPSI